MLFRSNILVVETVVVEIIKLSNQLMLGSEAYA